MLKKISNETLRNFFEQKTPLTVAQLYRNNDLTTVILVDCNNDHYVTFQVNDKICTASPKERLGNMPELFQNFLAEQAQIQKQEYYAKKNLPIGIGVTQ